MDLENTGVIGPQSFRQDAEDWYFYSYDPRDVKAWGSPTDTKLGVSYATWQPIIKAATSDIQYINAWTAKQPLKYRESVDLPGPLSMTQQLKDFEKTYTEAKTPTAKHAAWTAFWQWVGTYAAGTAGMVPGSNAQVYADKYEPSLGYHLRIWEGELDETSSAKQTAQLVGKIDDGMIHSAYDIPIAYGENVYLVKPDLTGVQANPWQFQYLYQFQYMKLK